VTADGQLVLAVNPDSNSLSVVDATTQTKLAEIPVGLDPRTVAVDDKGERAYVANRGSDTVSVVDLSARTVIADVPLGDRPYGVVVAPDGSQLYVAEQGVDRLTILDTATFEIVDTIATLDRPSGLAISDDGHTLYVTHLLSGQVMVIRFPYLLYLPLILKGAEGFGKAFAIPPPQSPILPTEVLTTVIPTWPDANLSQSIVIDPTGNRAYLPQTRSNTANRALTFDSTVFPLVSVIDLTTRQHLVGRQISLPEADEPVGLPFDAAFTPDGGELWVLNAASNDISVINMSTKLGVAHIEVGHNPRGIVISPDGKRAYVNNTLDGTVSVIDTAAYTVTEVITVTAIPLPPALLHGKRLFHSSDSREGERLARQQWMSCNTCHFEGEHDGRTWFFGFAGPRNTTSLLGMIQTYPLRWSAEWDESADCEFAVRKEQFGTGLIDGEMNPTLGAPNQGRSYDLDCLALFIDSLPPPESPGPPSEAALRGQVIFNRADTGCAVCHPPPLYTDHKTHDVGTVTADERIGPERHAHPQRPLPHRALPARRQCCHPLRRANHPKP